MMKLALASLLLASANAASPAMRTLLSNARRLDDGGDNNAQEGNDGVYEFLDDYSIVIKECHSDITLLGDADYPIYGTVVFRLCPQNDCNPNYTKKGQVGCKNGHADFAVDIGTFVAAMMEDQADNMNWDDQYGDLANYAECAQYDAENGGEYYVGPACMTDGLGIKLAVFDEATCQTESSSSFEDISNGWSLPYTDGGLVSTQCTSCYDDDQGGPKELCMNLYDYAKYRCEEDWDVNHYYYDAITEVNKYGRDTTGCVTMSRFNYTKPKVNVWEELGFVMLLLLLTAGGYYAYTQWWEGQMQNLERIDTDEEGDGEDEEGDGNYDDYVAHDGDDDSQQTPTGGVIS